MLPPGLEVHTRAPSPPPRAGLGGSPVLSSDHRFDSGPPWKRSSSRGESSRVLRHLHAVARSPYSWVAAGSTAGALVAHGVTG